LSPSKEGKEGNVTYRIYSSSNIHLLAWQSEQDILSFIGGSLNLKTLVSLLKHSEVVG
jgi:hypothetical protein